jgi:hypothetical protein
MAHPFDLFSIDPAKDSLLGLDTAGNVTEIGSLGVDVTGMQLEWHLGVLYGLTGGFNDQDLFRIDTTTGAATLVGDVLLSGNYVGLTEAIVSFDGDLYISYNTTGNSTSDRLGLINPSNAAILSSVGIGPDADSLGYDGANGYMIDNSPGGDSTLYSADLSTGGTSQIGVMQSGAVGGDGADMAFLFGDLYTLSIPKRELWAVDKATGSFTAVDLNPDYTYSGLAAVPEPATMLALGAGIAALVSRRRKN